MPKYINGNQVLRNNMYNLLCTARDAVRRIEAMEKATRSDHHYITEKTFDVDCHLDYLELRINECSWAECCHCGGVILKGERYVNRDTDLLCAPCAQQPENSDYMNHNDARWIGTDGKPENELGGKKDGH